jgi:predicted DNA-binding transcriptional regulator YafY
MSELVRLYRYKSLLSGRRAVSAQELMAALEISRATFKRDLAKLRDQFHVPIEFNRELGGYQMESGQSDSELPGLWFSQQEILALLTIQQLLEQLEPGLLGAKLRPLKDRLTQLMDKHGLASQDVAKRIRIVHAGKRLIVAKSFEAVAAATLARKRLKIWHFSRQNGNSTEREVSPLRLVHYRDNWYLDAWCHLREELRSFSIDAVTQVQLLDRPAREVGDAKLDATFGPGYGIFSGGTVRWARLRFTPERARWVAREQWHPQQQGTAQADGSYLLRIPYTDHRELIMDILKHGAHCEVLGTPSLRQTVAEEVGKMAKKYLSKSNGRVTW